jgi:hypothetical protein
LHAGTVCGASGGGGVTAFGALLLGGGDAAVEPLLDAAPALPLDAEPEPALPTEVVPVPDDSG